MNINDFAKNFNGAVIPDELVKLLEFENNIAKNEFYAAGFELTVTEEKYGLKTYSENVEFLNSILEFANADGSGSSYGFWSKNGAQNLKMAPIVIFGGEGGFHVVASNILELFQILLYDTEPMVSWDKVYYYKDESDFEPSEQSAAFKKWVAENFKIDLTYKADDIVKAAQIKQQEEFKTWMEKYYR